MDTHAQKARQLFESGYNCAQSVFAAFSDVTGMDHSIALRLSSSFGGGVGRLRELCGAVSGMAMVLGLLYGYEENDDDTAKAIHYARVQQLAQKFEQENGALTCRALLGLPSGADSSTPSKRTAAYYAERPCAHFVESAAAILDEYLHSTEAPVQRL